MQSISCHKTILIIYVLVSSSLLFSSVFCLKDFREKNRTSMEGNELKTMKLINAHLRKINKPFLKSIKSPDGDIIDCVLFHLQPAFDRLELKEKMSVILPELPKGYNVDEKKSEIKQLWNSKGESCPDGTVPIRRTTASEILRSGSISKFGKKYNTKEFILSERAQAYVKGEILYGLYGGKAIYNVWKPNITGNMDVSLSKLSVTYDVPDHPINNIQAGWRVSTHLNKDNHPRLYTYWTPDGYRSGCYNMLCPGFIQISKKVSLGAAIYPISRYGKEQYDVDFFIWKDILSGDWWLKAGREIIGYWPKSLFTGFQYHATLIEYGGEVFSRLLDQHTSTQMGSGHFQDEGFGKSAYVRNLEVVDQYNTLNTTPNLILLADSPNCYGVKRGYGDTWGNFIYFGGPGYNPKCP